MRLRERKMIPIIINVSSDMPKQGKDTFCIALKNHIPNPALYLHTAFAKALKEYVCEKYGLDPVRLDNDNAYKELYRPKLIEEGDGVRLTDGFVWCKKLNEKYVKPYIQKIGNDLDKIPFIAISDNRYMNEDDYFKEEALCGFHAFVYTVHIVVNDSVMKKRFGDDIYLKLAATERNRSQRELNFKFGAEFDSIISNNGSISEFYQKVNTEYEIIISRYLNFIGA
jgi:phosphomevalonate kinase